MRTDGESGAIAPFPWHSLRNVPRGQWLLLRRWLAHLGCSPGLPFGGVHEALGALDLQTGSVVALASVAQAATAVGSDGCVVLLRSQAGPWALVLEAVAARYLANLGSGDPLSAGRLQPRECDALVARLCGWVQGQRGDVFVDGVEPLLGALQPLVDAGPAPGVELHFSPGAFVGRGLLVLPEATLLAAPTRRSMRGGQWVTRFGPLRSVARAVLGEVRLSPRELTSLRVADVLVFDSGASGATLRVGRVRWPVTWDPTQAVAHITGDAYLAGNGAGTLESRSHKGDDMGEIPTDILLRGVEVEILAVAGRLSMPLADLSELVPGAVVSLGRPVGSEVELHVGGVQLGRGELMTVDGEVAVRIVEWARPALGGASPPR
jgi:flagellar motor switch/type III secretory pathway protein FliN